MTWPAVAVVGVAAACGRLGFETVAEGQADASAPPPLRCRWDFVPTLVAPPQRLDAFATDEYEADPTLSSDERTLYFARGGQIWAATRADRASSFGAATLASEVSGLPGSLSGLAFDADGLGALVAIEQGGNADLVRLARADAGAPFAEVGPVAELTSAGHEYNGRTSPDQLALAFVRWTVPGDSFSSDLFVATRSAEGEAWRDVGPASLSRAGIVEAGAAFVGGARVLLTTIEDDLVVAWRQDVDAPFDLLLRFDDLSTTAFDGLPWVSADGCEVFFVSGRGNGDGNWDLYRAEVAPP